MSEYNIFTSDMNNLSDPQRTDLFSVVFYDSTGFSYRYSTPESSEFFAFRSGLPKQSNVLAKRWYFGTYRRDVINSDRGGEIPIEFYLRSARGYNLKLFQFMGMPIGEEFLDEEQRYKHVEFNKRFDRIELTLRSSSFKNGTVFTLYNCNVKDLDLNEVDAQDSNVLRLTATVSYDTFDVRNANESKYRPDLS